MGKDMQMKRISIYNKFECVGADCAVNCCQGWRIPVDHDQYLKYLNEKGIFGALLRCFLKKQNDVNFFCRPLNRCPFWGMDRLCMIQKKHGVSYMPAVCVSFPRQKDNFGFFCEETLFLACPEAARLFLEAVKRKEPFSFTVFEGQAGYDVNTLNDDREFLSYLLFARETLIGMLWNGVRFDSVSLLDYGRDAQKACLDGAALPDPADYTSGETYVMDVKRMNQLFFHGFFHPKLKTTSRFLYKLCKRYIREFAVLSKVNPEAANRRLESLRRDVSKKIPEIDELVKRYYEYYLLTNFLNIFEDYNFGRHLLFGVAKTNMMVLFLALYAEKKKDVNIDEITKVIAVFERRAFQIEDAVKKIQKDAAEKNFSAYDSIEQNL